MKIVTCFVKHKYGKTVVHLQSNLHSTAKYWAATTEELQEWLEYYIPFFTKVWMMKYTYLLTRKHIVSVEKNEEKTESRHIGLYLLQAWYYKKTFKSAP